jgi:hypothetical protein
LGDNAVQYKKIQSLATDTQIDYFSSILGSPAFKNPEGTNFEYIFVETKFYVQAIAEAGGKVLLYSVTTRSSNFRPTLDLGLVKDGKNFVVVLGKTKFSELEDKPIKIYWDQGARRTWYWEKYYFGNPQYYQNYDFAYSDAGYPHCEETVPVDMIGLHDKVDLTKLPPEIKHFRDVCVINTFSVSAPFSDIDDDVGSIGPDYDQVRLLMK